MDSIHEVVAEARLLEATHSYIPASFLEVFMIIKSCLPSGQAIKLILSLISKCFLSMSTGERIIVGTLLFS